MSEPGAEGVSRAIFSASDKRGLAEFGQGLHELGWDLVATSGSAQHLREADIPVTSADRFTSTPEILGGRVKTLDNSVFAGVLYQRGVAADEADVEKYAVPPIDLVACNFYAFADVVADPSSTLDQAITKFDVGGPAMIRAAAKNHRWVIPLVDPTDYPAILAALRGGGGSPQGVDSGTRRRLAAKAVRFTSAYDTAIADYLESPSAVE